MAFRFLLPFPRVFSKRTKRTVLCVSLAFSNVFTSSWGCDRVKLCFLSATWSPAYISETKPHTAVST